MARKYQYDVIYIGSGHGSDGINELAKKGYKVATVEAEKIGGTCPNWGCNAKITLDEPIKLTREQERMKNIVNGHLTVNWAANMKHKHEVIDPIPNGLSNVKEGAGVDIIHGWATLTDSHTVEVNGQKYTTDKIVLATGLHPRQLNMKGTNLGHNSKDFLSLDHLPKRIAIVGSGYIAMEFATIANQSGADVTVLMHHDRVLKQFYQPFVNRIVKDLKRRGMKFIPNAGVSSFSKKNGQLLVNYGNNQHLATDWILDATGRVPNVRHMGLEAAGVKYDRHGILVNSHLQTSVPNIYASGDVINSHEPKLTPTATFQGNYLMHLFSGETTHGIKYPPIPTVVFTSPRIAQVGISVPHAEKYDFDYDIVTNDLSEDWYRQIDKEQIAENALIFNKQGQLVGVTEISDRADDVIDTLLPAVALHLSKQQIEQVVPLFPSIAHDAWKNL